MHDDFDDRIDEDGLDDENEDDDQPYLPWPPPGAPAPRDPGARRRRTRGVLFVVTAVAAAAAGFGLATAASPDPPASPAANASPGNTTPSQAAPGQAAPSGGAGTAPGSIPSAGPGEVLHLEIGAQVTAVSATWITLGSGARQVTAAVTAATRVTGKVSSITGVRIGDLVSAQITGTDGKLTATAIQDPASIP